MRKLAVFLVICGFLAVTWGGFSAPPAVADPGDVNGDGMAWTLTDLNYLSAYLVAGGPPPPNPIDADVDGFPGINLGDVFHFAAYFVEGNCWPLPYIGVGTRKSSQIRFSSDLIFSMETGVLDTTRIKIIENGGPEIWGMVIPLSFDNEPNEVEVTLDSVSFDGSIVGGAGWSVIDNVNKTFLLYSNEIVPYGTTGLVATLYFTKTSDGDPLAISATEIAPSHSFTLLGWWCAGGPPSPGRMLTPKISLSENGDVNCDGVIDIGDAVYITNYLYRGGPPPCGL
ncbi:MAG: hypothetical protein WBC88_09795 [Candidatus Zixiibacteriota bacterium]